MRSLYSVVTLVILIFCYDVFAKITDKEVIESLKCIKMFPYFEKIHKIPQDTLLSIALKESGKLHSKHNIRIVWPWTVNIEGNGYYFNNKRDAMFFVKQQIIQGKTNIDIGCMQINLKHHPEAFKSLNHAFEPRFNVAYGANFLKSKYNQCGNWKNAIGYYHSATDHLRCKYQEDVIRIVDSMSLYKTNFRSYAYMSSLKQKNNELSTNEVALDEYLHRNRANKFKNEMSRIKMGIGAAGAKNKNKLTPEDLFWSLKTTSF